MKTIKPYDYQIQGVNKIQKFGGRALLADDMGLGKTPQSLLWAYHFLKQGPVLIICNATLKGNWQRECRKFIGARSTILEGKTPPLHFLGGRSKNEILILNYDILGKYGNKKSWVYLLKKLKPGLVIIDEAQSLGNPKTIRTRAVLKLCQGVPHVIGVTGTPIPSKNIQMFPILHIIAPELFPDYHAFGMRYCKPVRTPWGWQYNGVSNAKELNRILRKHVMVRRLKKDVLKELPDKIRNIMVWDFPTPEMKKEYFRASTEFMKWLTEVDPSKAKTAKNMEFLVKGGYLLRLAGKMKIQLIVAWIKRFFEETGRKLIVFGMHYEVINALHEAFPKISVVVTGKVKGSDRDLAILAFQKRKDIKLFIGNMLAAGTGWNGVSASDVLITEFGWRPGDHTQAEDRAHRIGQTEQVTAHYPVLGGTIEEAMCRVIEEKQGNADAVLDGIEGESTFDLVSSIKEKLLEMEKERKWNG